MKEYINQAANNLFRISVQYKAWVVFLFKLFYLFIIGVAILSWGAYKQGSGYEYYQQLGTYAGDLAVVTFVVSLIPGICRRFALRQPLIQLVMLYRRYLGILMFFLSFLHGFIFRMLPALMKGGIQDDPLMMFEVFGLITLYVVLLPLAATSNDWSVRTMGKWWKRLHLLSYVGLWLVFLHLILVEVSLWSILIGATLLVEISSHVFAYRHAREASQRRTKTQYERKTT